MHPQLQSVTDEFAAAQERLHALSVSLPEEWWAKRADPARWSVGECVAHLNLTAEAYLPLVRRGIEEGARLGGEVPARFRRDPTGWLLWRLAGPPVRHRVRTTAPFVPAGSEPRAHALGHFDRLQAEQVCCVRQADGLPLGAIRITSPFDPRMRYNLYSCLTILPRHQHRHIWQAEQVLERLRRKR
jgi:DinB superfamily